LVVALRGGTGWEAGVFVAIGRVRLGVGDGAAWG